MTNEQHRKSKIKLTEKQGIIMEEIKSTPGGYLRIHMRPTGAKCYRLMDGTHSPVKNFGTGIIDRMINNEHLEKTGNIICIKPNSDN